MDIIPTGPEPPILKLFPPERDRLLIVCESFCAILRDGRGTCVGIA